MSKKNANIHIITQTNFFNSLKNKHLILDTSVFIDALNHQEEFVEFFNDCREYDVILTTTKFVEFEFIKGAENKKILSERLKVISQIIEPKYYLRFTKDLVDEHIPHLLELYKQHGSAVSVTDLQLASLLLKHEGNLFLLTKNPKDFPTSIFTLNTHFVVHMNRALQVYGVYSYSGKKKKKTLEEIPF